MTLPPLCKNAVLDGLDRLLALGLSGRPAAADVQSTALAWIDALSVRAWDDARDQKRIETAFRRLSAVAQRWPAPAQLIDALPPRLELVKKPAPASAAADSAAKRARMQQIITRLTTTRGLRINTTRQPVPICPRCGAQHAVDDLLSDLAAGRLEMSLRCPACDTWATVHAGWTPVFTTEPINEEQ